MMQLSSLEATVILKINPLRMIYDEFMICFYKDISSQGFFFVIVF